MIEKFPLTYTDGPDYCLVEDATGAAFAMTVQPKLLQDMERAYLAQLAQPMPAGDPPAPERQRLTEAQRAWLKDPRPYFHQYKDRTAAALIRKGFIEITEQWGPKAGYRITPAGRAALAKGGKPCRS